MLGPLEEKKHVNNLHSLEMLQENIRHEMSMYINTFSRCAASLEIESSL
jgi:hypothetical protein